LVRIEPHPLVALGPRLGNGALGERPPEAEPPRLGHNVKPLDLGDAGLQRFQPDDADRQSPFLREQETFGGWAVGSRQSRQFGREALKGEAERQRVGIAAEQTSDHGNVRGLR